MSAEARAIAEPYPENPAPLLCPLSVPLETNSSGRGRGGGMAPTALWTPFLTSPFKGTQEVHMLQEKHF